MCLEGLRKRNAGIVDKMLTVMHVALEFFFILVLILWGWHLYAARTVASSLEKTGSCPDPEACSGSATLMVRLGIMPPVVVVLGLLGLNGFFRSAPSDSMPFCLRLPSRGEDFCERCLGETGLRVMFWLFVILGGIGGVAIAGVQIHDMMDAAPLSARVIASVYAAALFFW